MDRVRDAMVPEPRTLSGDSPAQEAGELLSRPEVRAVFVAEDERKAGETAEDRLQPVSVTRDGDGESGGVREPDRRPVSCIR